MLGHIARLFSTAIIGLQYSSDVEKIADTIHLSEEQRLKPQKDGERR